MNFDADRCIIKGYYCGDGDIPDERAKFYKGVGTRNQCMKKGFGVGMYSEQRKSLPQNSLQNIPYVGPVMEKNLIKFKINDTDELIQIFKGVSAEQIKAVLKKCLRNKGGDINKKAYNSVLLYLNKNGVKSLPKCKIIA